MPSGKQSRKRRQAVRVPAPPGRRRQASPKVLLGAAAVLVLVGVGVGLAIALSRSSSSSSTVPTRGSLVGALPHAAEVQRLLRGVPQHGNVLGSPSAAVTVVEYVDLQCPYCQQFDTQALPGLLSRYVRTGKAKLEARVLAFIGPDSQRGRDGALAAAEQNRLFDFAELLYFNQGRENTGWLSDTMVEQVAASISGLDVPRLLSARKTGAVKDQATRFDTLAQTDNVSSTPTVLVGRSGSTLQPVALASPTDERSVAAAIAHALG